MFLMLIKDRMATISIIRRVGHTPQKASKINLTA